MSIKEIVMNNKGNELVLYHGSPVLASEWSVCNPIEKNGWVHKFVLDTSELKIHKFVLDTSELKILDFEKYDILSWLAELMKHRDADTGRRYRVYYKCQSRKWTCEDRQRPGSIL